MWVVGCVVCEAVVGGQKLQTLGEFVDFGRGSAVSALKLSKRFRVKKRAGTMPTLSSIGDGDETDAQQRKFSNIINKKFNELMGRNSKTNQTSPVGLSGASSSSTPSKQTQSGVGTGAHSSCNLDHIIADDAVSIVSGSDNEENDGAEASVKHKEVKRATSPSRSQRSNGNSTMKSTQSPSLVASALP